jgi:uncharacterized Fe-S cluster protein YjdI
MKYRNTSDLRFSQPVIIQSTPNKHLNAKSCSNSRKRIRNNSVYCNFQERGWISPKNCEACSHYKLDPNVTSAAREEGSNSVEIVSIDRAEGIIDEEKEIANDTKEADESLIRINIEEKEHG